MKTQDVGYIHIKYWRENAKCWLNLHNVKGKNTRWLCLHKQEENTRQWYVYIKCLYPRYSRLLQEGKTIII